MPLKKKKSKPAYAGTNHPAVAAVACPFCHEPAGGPCKRRAAYNPTRTFFPTHQARIDKYEGLKKAVAEADAKEAARKAEKEDVRAVQADVDADRSYNEGLEQQS